MGRFPLAWPDIMFNVLLTIFFLLILHAEIGPWLLVISLIASGFFLILNVMAPGFIEKRHIILLLSGFFFVMVSIYDYMLYGGDIYYYLVELKLPAFLLIFFLVTELKNKYKPDIRYAVFFIFLYSMYIWANANQSIKFVAYAGMGLKTNYLYFGVTLLILASYASNFFLRIGFLLLVTFSASLTAYLAMVSYLYYSLVAKRNLYVKTLVFLFLFVLAFNMLDAFSSMYYEMRGRDLREYESLDRYMIFSSFYEYFLENVSLLQVLFGFGAGSHNPELLSYITDDQFYNWLYVGNAHGYITPRVSHNDYLRIFFNFGLIGLGLLLYVVYSYFRAYSGLLVIIGVASLSNSILYNDLIFYVTILALFTDNKTHAGSSPFLKRRSC